MKRFLSILLVLAITMTFFVGCGKKADESDYKTTLDDIKEKGEFVVGLDDTFAPMGFRETDGTLVGFDIDLAEAVSDVLGVKVRFQPIAWDAKEMELAAGKIDCIWNGLSVTPERTKMLSLSDPYLENYIIVMTNPGVEIPTIGDLANFNIGIQASSAALEAVKADDLYDTYADNIVEFATYDEVILEMRSGRLDCMVIDQVFGEYKNAQIDGEFGVADFDFGEDLYAIGFRKSDTELTKEVNKAILELVENGTTSEISKKWFGKDIVLG